MISEGSCDTDWNNDAEKKNRKQFFLNLIYCSFNQINAALVSRRDFLRYFCILCIHFICMKTVSNTIFTFVSHRRKKVIQVWNDTSGEYIKTR